MIDRSCWQGRSVFVTGHTGFKGGWIVHWLQRLGAQVSGFSLPPETEPNLFSLTDCDRVMAASTLADIRDANVITDAVGAAKPELIIHMAAQPLVRHGYEHPVETWSTNVLGTVHLLEAALKCASVKAVLVVTTDKCYENKNWLWGYRETDELGGHDPYSASKAATELVVQSYRRSFFERRGVPVATARAGNVIGGGDWSADRLIPDAVRAAARKEPLIVRNPHATRPWQHVLDCLSGYLRLSELLLSDDGPRYASQFNFGPPLSSNVTVASVLGLLETHWPELQWQCASGAEQAQKHEANLLYLDSSKARFDLGWRPRWDLQRSVAVTAEWYRTVLADASKARALVDFQIQEFANHV